MQDLGPMRTLVRFVALLLHCARCAFSIFVLVEIVQLFALACIAHSWTIHPVRSQYSSASKSFSYSAPSRDAAGEFLALYLDARGKPLQPADDMAESI